MTQSFKTPTQTPLLGLSLAKLTEWVQQQGQPAYRGKQLYQWIYQKGTKSLADITVFSKQWREKIGNKLGIFLRLVQLTWVPN